MDNQDPKQSSSPFQSLPSELLSNIFGYLPQGVLYQQALVNKHTSQLAVPVLHVPFSQYRGDITQVRQYFRIIQRVPELAKHLRDVTIKCFLKTTHKQVRKRFLKIDKDCWAQRLYLNHHQFDDKYFPYGSDLEFFYC
jgi:hypothetical protein